MQNACKLVINETIARKLGFDVHLYKDENKNSNQFADEQSKLLGIKIEKSDYIQFTKIRTNLHLSATTKNCYLIFLSTF